MVNVNLEQYARDVQVLESLNKQRRARNKISYHPRAFAYCRVSKDEQLDGLSMATQEGRCQSWFRLHLEANDVTWVRSYSELDGQSATRKPFHHRPMGRELMLELQSGDHVIVDKVDRIFRSAADFLFIRDFFQRMGVFLHIVDLNGLSVEGGTPMGDFVMQLFVSIAQLESATLSSRIKKVFREMHFQRPWLGFVRPNYGARNIFECAPGQFVPDPEERAFMSEIVEVRPFKDAKKYKKLTPPNRDYPDGFWRRTMYQNAYTRELWLRQVEDTMKVRGWNWVDSMRAVGLPRPKTAKKRPTRYEWQDQYNLRRSIILQRKREKQRGQ